MYLGPEGCVASAICQPMIAPKASAKSTLHANAIFIGIGPEKFTCRRNGRYKALKLAVVKMRQAKSYRGQRRIVAKVIRKAAGKLGNVSNFMPSVKAANKGNG